MSDGLPGDPRRGPARVHIYGAGIAGLTAAHELARRGFRVRVYEPAQEFDERGQRETGLHLPVDGKPELAVGGRARSQFMRAAKGALGNFPQDGRFTTSDAYQFIYDYTQSWRYSTVWWSQNRTPRLWLEPDETAFAFLRRGDLLPRERFPGILHIRVPQPYESGPPPTRRVSAEAVRDHLMSGERLPSERIIVVGEEEEELARQLGMPLVPLKDRNELLLEVVHFLPGEHGFRFFPAGYRHLRSTLAEIPLLDDRGRPTGRSVADNLVPASFHGPGARGHPPEDTRQLSLRLWRYLCTSSERRRAEYEHLTWREYLEGHEPRTGRRRHRYSGAFERARWPSPTVPAVFGEWGDARTHGNALAQHAVESLRPRPGADCTLNGPTTLAWLRPWRRFLAEHLRVEFMQGELTRLELEEGNVVPYVTGNYEMGWGEWEEKPDRGGWLEFEYTMDPVNYFIVATDAATAEKMTRRLPRIGVVKRLRGFTTRIPPNPRGPGKERPRKKHLLPGHLRWDRFQTRPGIQYFFHTSVRLEEGCLQLPDTPWSLSVINNQRYWALPPALEQEGFTSVLSVSIGDWHARGPGMRASECSRHELAQEVWRQLREALEQPPHGFSLPEPSWYHVDHFLRFGENRATGKERAAENQAPYLGCVVGDWSRRPGPEPWDPWAKPGAGPARSEPLSKGLWQAPHGGYYMHWGRLVFAGTYLKTFTRMTSMEAANESARHAVNAILDHYLAHHGLTGSDSSMTPVGEYCRIWDPEKHEAPELEALRALDAKLFAQGLPHVWDVLELEPLVLPLLPPPDSAGGAEALLELLQKAHERLETKL